MDCKKRELNISMSKAEGKKRVKDIVLIKAFLGYFPTSNNTLCEDCDVI